VSDLLRDIANHRDLLVTSLLGLACGLQAVAIIIMWRFILRQLGYIQVLFKLHSDRMDELEKRLAVYF
jgi:hypothetical protein